MTPEEAATLLQTTFRTNWANRTPIAWGNTVPNPPATEWVRFTVRHGASRLRSWTGRDKTYNRAGFCFAQVYTPLATGEQRGRQLGQMIRTIFEGKSFSGLDCLTVGLTEIGNESSGAFQTNVSIEFRYDEIVPG